MELALPVDDGMGMQPENGITRHAESMPSGKYLIRFDDICPTMNWHVWEKIEKVLVEREIRPILAVVPDNRDEKLVAMPPRADFWEKVRAWQSMGWCIALHGYEHLYVTDRSGLIGLNARSEFAGLSCDVQEEKLRKGLAIFRENGVTADAWVAPAHSFDENTVELLVKNGITTISDGYYLRSVKSMDAVWVPQQLWKFRYFPFGLWTVCYHINEYGDKDIQNIISDIDRYKHNIISIDDVVGRAVHDETLFDRLFARGWKNLLEYRRKFS